MLIDFFEKKCYILLIESKMKRAIVFNDLLKFNTWHPKNANFPSPLLS